MKQLNTSPSLLLAGLILLVAQSASFDADAKFPSNIAELYHAEANFLDNTERQVLASTYLQEALESGLMLSTKEQDKAKARNADSQLDWGMHYLPSAIYQQLVDRSNPYKVPDETWLKLATTQFWRGYWGLTGSVEYTLSRVRKHPGRAVRGERTMLRSQLYLKQNRFAQAERTLARYRGEFDVEPYAEFNRAIAMLKQNKGPEGGALLDKVGNLRTDDDTLLALRDLANYTLGNWFLNNDQAGTAIPILKKVRVEGPYSNKALLALGWAYLSSTGKLQRIDEIFSPRCLTRALAKTGTLVATSNNRHCRPGRTLRIENLGKKEKDRLQRAMTAWQIVQERSPLFPGVQETLMALPFALDQLGYTHVAETQYKQAIRSLQYEASRINDALDVIHAGKLLQPQLASYQANDHDKRWDLSGLNLSKQLDTRLLYRLYSEHEFYEALVNYRQLRRLQSHIGERIERLKTSKAPAAKRSSLIRPQSSLKISATAPPTTAGKKADAAEIRQHLLRSVSTRGLSTQLSETGQAATKRKSKLTVWMTHEKTSNANLATRQDTLLKKAETLYKQLGSLAAKHAGYLSSQSEMELNIKLERVNTYMAQARLSLGRVNDRQADQRIQGERTNNPSTLEELDFDPLFKVQPIE